MIYIDNAATSRKKPLKVIFSALTEMILSANAGRSGHRASMRTAMKIEETRDAVRKYFFDGNVIFTKNCTEALNLAIAGSRPSGRVITTVYEHNSVLRTLKRQENEGKIILKIISPEKGSFENPLKNALTRDTSMVIITAMSNVTGEKTDVEELAKIVKSNTNALVVVDTAQSAGHIKFDYENVDMAATSGHKGLCGLQGTGFLLCKKNIKLDPILTGGTGTSSNSIDIPKEIPEGMEAGTLNAVGIISLKYGIEHAFENFDRINNKISRLSEMFCEGLKNIGGIKIYSCANGIVLCNFSSLASGEAADILSEKYGICVRSGLHCAPLIHNYLGTIRNGALRFSFGENNCYFQVPIILAAMKKIALSAQSSNTIK